MYNCFQKNKVTQTDRGGRLTRLLLHTTPHLEENESGAQLPLHIWDSSVKSFHLTIDISFMKIHCVGLFPILTFNRLFPNPK